MHSIERMTNLKRLVLLRNKFTHIQNNSFSNLTLLEQLKIEHNELVEFDPIALAPLCNLRTFEIDHFENYTVLSKFIPKDTRLHISMDGWNCSYSKAIAKVLFDQGIKLMDKYRYVNSKEVYECTNTSKINDGND